MKRLGRVRRMLSPEVLRHPGIRARIYLSLLVAVVAMAPVVVQSLFYIGQLGDAVERLDEQGAQVHELLTDLSEGARSGRVDELRQQLAEIDARLLGMEAARSDALTTLEESRRNVLTVLILTAAALALLVWLLPRRVVAPLRRILNVLRRAAQGDYAVKARLEAPDEVGAMAREVNRLLTRVDEAVETREQLIRSVRRDMDLFGRSLPQAVCIVDPERRLLWANEAFEGLVGAEEDPTTTCVDRWIGGDAFARRLHDAFAGGVDEGEVDLELPDGTHTRRWMYTAAGRDPEGGVDRVAVVLADRPRSEPSRAGARPHRDEPGEAAAGEA